MNKTAIEYYNDLLRAMSTSEIEGMQENFLANLSLRKASYGDRLLTRYLRPKFLTIEQMKTMRRVCTTLRNVIVKVKDAYFDDMQIQADIALTEGEQMLAAIEPGFSRICVTSRWDSFWGEQGLKFVELNAECPAGVAYTDIMSQVYQDLPVMRRFTEKYRAEPFYVREMLLDALLFTYLNWQGNKSPRAVPNIAIVDWEDVPTYSEFELLQTYFEFHGLNTIIADPRELDYSGSRLRKGDFEIDLVYRRVLTQEFLEKLDEVQPMLQAYRDRNVCMVNSFRTKMLHKKSVFAILSDSRNAGYFSAGERRVIDAHIPWTRLISDCKTDFHGETIDLLNYISRNRENLVIKPNDEYGGKGVVIGWETSQEAWEKAVQSAQDDVWVVQEKVPLAKEVFAYYEDGLQFKELLVDLDPFLFGVNVAGFLTRLSTSSLANVTAGGGATVTFIIEEV